MKPSTCRQIRVMMIKNWEESSDLILVLCLDPGRVLEIREEPVVRGTLDKAEVRAISVGEATLL